MDAALVSTFPWYAWVPIVGAIVVGVTTIVRMSLGRNTELAKALQQNAEVNEKIVARLDSMDKRLGGLESTLNDIPN